MTLTITVNNVTREMTKEEEAAWLSSLPTPPAPTLPSLTRRQLLLGLLSIGIHEADVDAKVTQLPADQVDVAQITWKYASEYKRDDPLVSTLAAAFALPDNQVDDLWTWAASL